MEYRRANLNEPSTIDEARERMIDVTAEIAALQSAMDARFRYRDDGMPMDPEEYIEWRRRASGAKNWFLREQIVLETWIKVYEQDLRAEEDAERRKLEREERAKAREWKERMLREHGTTKLPQHILNAQHLERQRNALQLQEKSEKATRRKTAHREYLQMLRIENPIDGLSIENLLGHAYRLLFRLMQERRVLFTPEERAVLGIIEERYLILESFSEHEEELGNERKGTLDGT